jgi:hypothetical protein
LFVVFEIVLSRARTILQDWNSAVDPSSITKLLETKKIIVSEPYMLYDKKNPEKNAENEYWCTGYYKNYIPPGENCKEPMSFWYIPLFDEEGTIEIARDKRYPDEYEMKGMLAVEFRWRSFFVDILPPGSNGIILVTSNPCGPDDFSYQIYGPDIKFLGAGDFHDKKYDKVT